MIYTIGNRESYHAALAQHNLIEKIGCKMRPDGSVYPGGSVWKTCDDAQAWLDRPEAERILASEFGRKPAEFEVFGVEADWEGDTAPSNDGPWHNLTFDSKIVDLCHDDV